MSSPSWLDPEELPEVTALSEEECWSALSSARVGRLAVTAEDGADIYPVNFVVKDGNLFFRTAPGSKLMAIATRLPLPWKPMAQSCFTAGAWSFVAKLNV